MTSILLAATMERPVTFSEGRTTKAVSIDTGSAIRVDVEGGSARSAILIGDGLAERLPALLD